jgi:hypothetical protein
MLTEDQLKWTQRDTEIVERHKKEVASGMVKTVNFLELKKE